MRTNRVLFYSFISGISVAAVLAACAPNRGGDADGPDDQAGAGGSDPVGDAGNTGGQGGGGIDLEDVDAGEVTLGIEPADPVVVTDGTPTTVQLSAKTSTGEPASVTWLIDDVVVGTIAQDGLFTAKGLVAGKAKVTARYGQLEASTTVTVQVKASQSLVDTLTEDERTLCARVAAAIPPSAGSIPTTRPSSREG